MMWGRNREVNCRGSLKRSIYMNRTALLLGSLFLAFSGFARDRPAKFVWKDPEGSGRQQTLLFRRSFSLEEAPGRADIYLFADSRYHLYVNGTHINFGPSRFYPSHPEYDSYDISRFLVPGRNVVAVEVLTNGTVTFQVPLSVGGFIAWGEVEAAPVPVSLATPGEWRMFVSDAYDHEALRFSFACGPMEIFDGRKQPASWNRPDFDDSGWEKPVIHGDQGHWGALTPRTIPQLTQDELLPLRLTGIYREHHQEEIYTFFVKTPDRTAAQYNAGKQLYACTYLYSPAEQDVEMGLWWGEYYLNGEGPIPVSGREPGNPVRENRIFALKKGWNFLFVSYMAIWGGWDFYMAVPREAGLLFSPERTEREGPFILTAGPFPGGAGVFDPGEDDPGDDREIMENKDFHWVPRENLAAGPNPARDLVWREPDLQHNLKNNDFQVSDFSIGEPLMLVFDMGGKRLGRIFCEVEAKEGTLVDIAWSEELNSLGMPFLYKRLQVNAAARFIASGGSRRYETFKPYGVRYLLVRIDPGSGPCRLKRLGMVEQLYPHEKRGSFTCSNPMLDRIWEMGWRTLRVCSEDSYIDTPFRERGLYAGDAVPEYAITLATSGDSRLLKRSLMLFQEMYRENMLEGKEEGLSDFVLKTLLLLEWYYQVTGDREFLEQLYPNYHSLMQHIMARRNEKGYYPTRRVFIEWTRINKDADLTAYQALVARSFHSMSFLAGELGREDEAERYAGEAERLGKLVSSLFWDPGRQVYHDGFRDGVAIDHHYPISSAFPLLFDLCPEEQKSPILSYLETELQDIGEETRNRKISPYGSFYLFAALYKEGRADLAEQFMLRYWSRMIHQGDDTSWENFDIDDGEDGGGQGTASHAWSGHPTFFLSTEVLGVKLGFNPELDRDRIEISPQSETLSWARGSVPHPAGMVHVEWQIKGDRLEMELTLPGGVEYTVRPRGRLATYALDVNVKIENSF
jgi:alpha-L-rhamnosidase